MRIFGPALALGLVAGTAQAQQLIPLGAPIMPQPKTKAAQPAGPDQTGRMKAARPLGSNYSPYSIQPLSGVPVAAPSTMPEEKTVNSGVVTDPNALDDPRKPVRKTTPADQSDLQKLAPKGAERTELPKADSDADPSAPK